MNRLALAVAGSLTAHLAGAEAKPVRIIEELSIFPLPMNGPAVAALKSDIAERHFANP